MRDPEIVVAASPDLRTIGQEWRALEERAGRFSFFQSWTWLGCLALERFTAPLLVRAKSGGRTVGLALLNRRGAALHLSESGEAERDAIYVEHNAPLLAADAPADLAGRMLAACWTVPGAQRLVLSGVPTPLPGAAGGLVLSERRLPAPFVDLAAVTRGGTDFLGSRSGNTRAQLRRSFRYFSGLGPVALERPEGEGKALRWLDEMIGLHTAAWGRRGRPGAFAGGFMRRFHAALVAAALPRGELDLLRIAAGGETLGFLYSFRHRGTVYAYQSGFQAFPGQQDARPGLVGHALAIEAARQAGLARYDFLAGDARYKRSLATGEAELAWAALVRPGLVGRMQVRASRALAGLRGRLARGLSSVRAAGSGST